MHLEEIESRESNSELSRYLTENCEKITDDFDLLLWWRCNSSKYPILSKLAKDILAVPVSTVASESTFNTGGRIIDSFRISLSATYSGSFNLYTKLVALTFRPCRHYENFGGN
jgi:hypothetical protein